MADINYTVGVETARANANLNRLKTNIKSTSGAFDGLRTAIASIAFGALVRNSLMLADAMVNMSKATGISVANITAFSQAMAAAGGTADRARDGISDLTSRLGEAALGSAELQSAFGRVGVSLSDLANLSTEEVFEKALRGLTEIPDQAQRSATAFKLFGESFKGIDIDKLTDGFDKNKASANEHAEAIESAAAAQTALTENLQKFNLALLEVLEPLNKLVSGINISVEAFGSLIKVLLSLGGAFLVFGKILPALKNFGGAIAAAGVAASAGRGQMFKLAGGVKAVGLNLARAAGLANSSKSSFTSLGFAINGVFKTLFRFTGIVGILYGVAEAVNAIVRSITGFDAMKAVTDKIGEGWDWVKGKLGFAKEETDKVTDATKATKVAQDALTNSVTDTGEEIRKVKDASIELIKATQDMADGFRTSNQELIDGLRLQNERIGLTADEVRYQETISNFIKQHNSQMASLNQKLRDQETITEAGQKAYAAIKEQIALLTQEHQKQLPVVKQLAEEYKTKTAAVDAAAEATRLAAENAKELARAVERASESARNFATKMADSTRDAQNELAMLDMGELEKSIFKIKTGISRDVTNEVRRLQEVIAKTGDPDGKIAASIQNIKQAGADAINAQSELAARSYEYQRSWSYGWEKAFRDYKDDATNAAKTAERVFSKATKGMEDAIVGFAKTGKFEWRDFVSSILEELLRAQIQQLIAQIFGSASPSNLFGGSTGGGGGSSGGGFSLGNIFSGIGNLFGGSQQQAPRPQVINPFNQNYPPQQSSGGLSSIVSGIGNAVSSIFGGSGGGIGSTISNAVSGIGNFFSGFFANGGMIPAGGYGIVGEGGRPEMVSGPAMVTPFGNTVVNYNINAVDAQSFAALVARDPGLIYAVTEQGRRNLATRR